MTQIIVDSTIRSKLRDLQEEIELVDKSGRILGHFRPAANRARENSREPKISGAEVRRRLKQGGGRTLPEILADLEKRA